MKVKNYLYILISLLATLNIQAQPSNDACTNAITITPNSCNPVSGTILNATQSISPISCNGTSSAAYDVWYKFVATSASHRIIVSPAANLDAVVDLRSGACTGTNIACADYGGGAGKPETINYTSFSIGSTYYIRIYASPGPIPSNPTFDIYVTASPAVTNDNCASAINLTPNSNCVNTSGSVGGATASGLAKLSCDAYIAAPPHLKDVWYKFTASNIGQYTVTVTPNTCTSYAGFDAVLGIYNSCGGSELYCADNGGGPGFAESITLSGSSGTTYFIRVYDYGLLEPTNPSFNICVVSSSGCTTPSNPPNPISNSPQCNSVTLTRGTPPGGVTYYWQGTSCGTSTSNSSLTYNATSSGTYYLRAYSNSGSCWSTGCSSVSVTVNSSSSAPSSASANPSSIISGGSSTLSLSGGSLGTGASWHWYSGSCGGTSIGQGNSISVSPITTTTYYVRAEGGTCGVTTSCASVTVSVGNSAPTINSITGINTIPGHAGITPNFNFYNDLSPYNVNLPIKICADGSNATKFRLSVSNTSGITLRILDENGLNQSDVGRYGEISSPIIVNSNEIEFTYLHPRYNDYISNTYRPCFLVVQYNGSTLNGISYPLNIYRAPVAMIHGFIGHADTFEDMEEEFVNLGLYPDYLLFAPEYYDNSTNSFITNIDELRYSIDYLLNQSRANHISCSKVDLVAHSMGGIISRLYIQGIHGFNYLNDVNKLITLNTPHSGTPLSNIRDYLQNGLFYCTISNFIGSTNWICDDAVQQFQPDSYMIDHALNAPSSIALENVPVHSIVSTSVGSYWTDPNYLSYMLKLFGNGYYLLANSPQILNSIIFDNEPHDIVVPLSSQQGGLTGSKTSMPGLHFHIGTPHDAPFINQVKFLLNNDPTGILFSQTGFNPVDLRISNKNQPNMGQNSDRSLNFDTIQIVSPGYASDVISGQLLPVTINKTSGINRVILKIGNEILEPFAVDSFSMSDSVVFNYMVTSEFLGELRIAVLGLDSLQEIAMDTIRVNVISTAILDSIIGFPSNILIPLDGTRHMDVYGYFNDGTHKRLTGNNQLIYNGDTATFAFLGDDKVKGLGVGDTTFQIQFQNKTCTIDANIYLDTSMNISLFASNKNNICLSDSVQFNSQSIGTPISYEWQFPGGTPSSSNDPNPIINYDTIGIYPVELITHYQTSIDTSILYDFITVNSFPTSTLNAIGPIEFCSGGLVVLQSDTGTYNSYKWIKDGVEIQGAISDSFTATTSGSYQVIVTNNGGCSSTSAIVPVTVHSLPPAVATPNSSTSFCAGGSVVLNANTGSGLTYQWTKYGNAVNGATSSSYTATTTGSYKVRVTDSNGCSNNSSPVLVTSIPAPPASITPAGSTTICAGSSVALNANVGTGYTYKWYKYSNVIDSTSGSTFVATSAGKYRVLVTDNFGCFRKSQPVDIFVVPKPAASITASGITTFCAGSSVTLNANQGSGLTYQWYKYSNPINGATASTYQATATGNYKVEVTNSNGCKKKSNSILVTVLALPTATITPSMDTGFCTGDSVLLSTGTVTGYSYQWKRYGNNISGATNQTYYAATAGAYKVTVTGPNGCTRNSPTINVSGPPVANITLSGATSVCPPDSLEIISSGSNGVSYQWYKNNIAVPGAINSSYFVNDSANYHLSLVNSYGCIDTSNVISIGIDCSVANFNVLFGDSTNGEVLFAQKMPGSNFLLTGYLNEDVFVSKLNRFGTLIWTKVFNTGNYELGNSCTFDAIGNIYILGYSNSNGKTLLLKINPIGDLMWVKEIGDNSQSIGNFIKSVSNTEFIITGSLNDNIYLAKVDSSGDIIWSKGFTNNNISEGKSLEISSDGAYIICGQVLLGSNSDCVLIKVDTSGNLIWSMNYDLDIADEPKNIVRTNDNGYLISGQVSSANLNRDAFLLKTDSTGAIVWTKTIGNNNPGRFEYFKQSILASNGNLISVGSIYSSNFKSDIHVCEVDINGFLISSRLLGSQSIGNQSQENGESIVEISFGNYLITGSTLPYSTNSEIAVLTTDVVPDSCYVRNSTLLLNTRAVNTYPGINTTVINPNSVNMTLNTSMPYLVESIVCNPLRAVQKHEEQQFLIYPNPAINQVTVDITLIESQQVEFKILHVDGREVMARPRRIIQTGKQTFIFDVSTIGSGVYYFNLTIGDKNYIQKLILVR